MKTCPQCGCASPADFKFCQSCGKDLAGLRAAGDTTVFSAELPGGFRAESRRTTSLDALFGKKNIVLLGRSPDADLWLSHPMISRHHALLERLPDGRLRLTDLESVNGVYVNGQRLQGSVILDTMAAVGIGPFLFTSNAGQLCTIDSSQSLRLEGRKLEKVVKLGGGESRKILDAVDLVVEPGEFVVLLGPSGSGKSTLMDCLNGRRWATGGQVLANGEDFYRYFHSFRQSLGYVPQKDIVHTQLTVYRALYYTAQLRLPPDTSNSELTNRIEEVIKVMELGPHQGTLVANLSGGQIKRVSLGAELLARPCLLFIDEATSGLDAGTEARMMRLFRQLADEGKSLICITHNVDNVDRCHLALILARGKLVYFGPPADAPQYFGVPRVSDIYDRIGERDLAEWEQQFRCSEFHQEFIAKRLAASDQAMEDGSISVPLAALVARPRHTHVVRRPKRPPLWHQFRVLTARFAELLWGDPRSLRLVLLQAPAVAAILLVGFIGKPFDQKLPRLRHLTPQEKNVLVVLSAIEQGLGVEGGADDEVEIGFAVQKLGKSQSVTVAQVREWLNQLGEMPEDSPQRKALEEMQIQISSGDAMLPIDLKAIRDMRQLLRQSKLSTRVLDADKDMPAIPDGYLINPRYTYMLLFMIVIVVLWFGCNTAAKEIVKEEAIYGRERAVNLGILPYLSSKFLLLSVVTLVQAFLLLAIIHGVLEGLHYWDPSYQVPPRIYCLDYLGQFGVLAILSMTGVGIGLLLSSCVASSDRANALLPYVLIPQIILGGGIMAVRDGALYWLAVVFSPVYWAFRAMRKGATTLPEYTGYRMTYTEDPWFACGVLVIQLIVLLVLTTAFLRRKDVHRE